LIACDDFNQKDVFEYYTLLYFTLLYFTVISHGKTWYHEKGVQLSAQKETDQEMQSERGHKTMYSTALIS